MDYDKENPIGLDASITKLKDILLELNQTWSLVNPEDEEDKSKFLDSYTRCEVIKKGDRNDVCFYTSKTEFPTISVAEGNKFFFLHRFKSIKEDAINYKSKIELIFIIDLLKVKPNVDHRADFEAQNDVELLLQQVENIWVESLDYGYLNALNGISYEQKNDVSQYHVFKFTLGIRYDMNETCIC